MRKTLAVLLTLALVLGFSVAAMADRDRGRDDVTIREAGTAGGSTFNDQETYGTNFQLDLYIGSANITWDPVWNPQLDASLLITKHLIIDKNINVDVDVNKTFSSTIDTVLNAAGGPDNLASQQVASLIGSDPGSVSAFIFWKPEAAYAGSIILTNVQIMAMSQTGGQSSSSGICDAYATGPGKVVQDVLNGHLVEQAIQASNGAIGYQTIQSISQSHTVVDGGGSFVKVSVN